MKLSAVVSTLGREDEFVQLFGSLDKQTFRDFEVIIIDQNQDDRLAFLDRTDYSFPLKRIRTPDARGLSVGRNHGLLHSQGEVVVFPDDDCWYPADLFERAVRQIEQSGADGVTGRAADEAGQSINGRFETSAQTVTRKNVWTTQIEWMAFFKRDLLSALGGYDPVIGVGAASPWQACEGQELVLRALSRGAKITFDPALFGHHASLYSEKPSKQLIEKSRKYARGHGRVLKMHGYSTLDIGFWVSRPSLKAAYHLARLRFKLSEQALNTAIGRFEGYFDSASVELHT